MVTMGTENGGRLSVRGKIEFSKACYFLEISALKSDIRWMWPKHASQNLQDKSDPIMQEF